MLQFNKVFYLLTTCILISVSSCSTIKNAPSQRHGSCYLENRLPYTLSSAPKPLIIENLDSNLIHSFSISSLNIANGIGVLDLLSEYVQHRNKYKSNPTFESRLQAIELFQRIDYRINLASLEISSIASEMDCEEEKITQLADFMKEKEGQVENRLNVAAIAVGAAGAILSGVLNDGGEKIAGVTGGIVEATLGTLMLVNQKKVYFEHKRNALGEVWNNVSKSEIFPPSIWYYLTSSDLNDDDQESKVHQIIERWMEFEQFDEVKEKKRKKLIQLYFGEGGDYTTEQLFNRANMLDQLESHIKLMKQELTLLTMEINQYRIN
ncbi:MAG TPA: hypothetical protein PKN38_05875 [Taishania sp.]|nr:hypothetical protein [Taishania sp.]